MKTLIIGGNGHISGAVVAELLKSGHDVTCLYRGRQAPINPDARRILVDRQDESQFESLIGPQEFDAVLDMVCFSGRQAESTMRAARSSGHVFFCSTVCIYGRRFLGQALSENTPPQPVTSYGRGKVEAEEVFRRRSYDFGIPVTIIRPSTTYGPRAALDRQLGEDLEWITRMRAGKPILIAGDGLALHQFLYVDDAARAIARLVTTRTHNWDTFNLASRQIRTWVDFHVAAMDATGSRVELVGVPLEDLAAIDSQRFAKCLAIYGTHTVYNCDRLVGVVGNY